MTEDRRRKLARSLAEDAQAYLRGRRPVDIRSARGRLLCGGHGGGDTACRGDLGWVGEPGVQTATDVLATLRWGFHSVVSDVYAPPRAEVTKGGPQLARRQGDMNVRGVNPKLGFPPNALYGQTGRRLRAADLPAVVICPRCLALNLLSKMLVQVSD